MEETLLGEEKMSNILLQKLGAAEALETKKLALEGKARKTQGIQGEQTSQRKPIYGGKL